MSVNNYYRSLQFFSMVSVTLKNMSLGTKYISFYIKNSLYSMAISSGNLGFGLHTLGFGHNTMAFGEFFLEKFPE